MSGAFDPVDGLVIEYVDSVCGSAKTLTAIAVALDRARTAGIKTLVAMPTLQLISEMSEVAKRQSAVPTVPVHIITNETTLARQTTVQALGSHPDRDRQRPAHVYHARDLTPHGLRMAAGGRGVGAAY